MTRRWLNQKSLRDFCWKNPCAKLLWTIINKPTRVVDGLFCVPLFCKGWLILIRFGVSKITKLTAPHKNDGIKMKPKIFDLNCIDILWSSLYFETFLDPNLSLFHINNAKDILQVACFVRSALFCTICGFWNYKIGNPLQKLHPACLFSPRLACRLFLAWL